MTKGLIYAVVGLSIACVFLGTLWRFEVAQLKACEANMRAFVAQVESNGKAAIERKKQKEKEDKAKKEKADREHKNAIAKLRNDNERLRNSSSAASGRVPEAPATSSRPDLACFDRADYQRAWGSFVERVRGLFDEGTENTLSLDTAKDWANDL